MIDPMDLPEELRLLLEKRSGEERRDAELAAQRKAKSLESDRRSGQDRRKQDQQAS